MMGRVPQRVESAVCVALLALAPLLLIAPLWVEQRVPLELRGAFFLPPWQEARPMGLEAPADPRAWEHAFRFYPWHRHLNEAGAGGRMPLWNSQEGVGTPFLAVWRTRALSPFSLPIYLLPLGTGLLLSIFLKMLVAGAGAYHLARRFGFHSSTALLAGLAYQWSGPIAGWAAMPLADTAAWLPLGWLALERLSLGHWATWPRFALVIALMGLGGEPKFLAGFVLICALYLPLRTAFDRAGTHPLGAGLATVAAWGGGVGLMGLQLLPYAEFWRHAAPWRDGPAAPPPAAWDALAVVWPAIAGADRPVAALLHGGVAPLLLLAVWIALRAHAEAPRRARIDAMIGAAGILAFAAHFTHGLWDTLPVAGRFGPEHAMAAWPLALGVAAAAAVEEWMDLHAEGMKQTLRRLALAGPLVLGGVAAAIIAGWAAGSGGGGIVFAVTAAGLAAALGWTVIHPNLRLLAWTAAALTLFGLHAAHGRALPSTPAEQVYPETEFIAALRATGARVGGSAAVRQWPLAGNGLDQVYAPGGVVLARYRAFAERVAEDPLLLRRTGMQALVLTKDDILGAYAPVRPLMRVQEVFPSGAVLFRDLQARPRARMIYAGRRVEEFDTALLNAVDPPLLEGATLPEHDDGREAQSAIVEESPERIVVRVGRTRPGVLVLADAHYPGWRATVNGRPAEIFPVDGLFRGVELSEGEHEVVFAYRPASLGVGLGITLVTGLILVMSGRPWRVLRPWIRRAAARQSL